MNDLSKRFPYIANLNDFFFPVKVVLLGKDSKAKVSVHQKNGQFYWRYGYAATNLYSIYIYIF